MNIIIDGYNLLKQLLGSKPIGEKERDWFLRKAAEYALAKKHKLFIVYDGGSHPRPVSEKKGSVVTVYSGYKLTADDVIKSYIDEGLLKDMLIVTTDRQLNRYASRAQVPSIDSLDFYKLMNRQKPESVVGYKKAPGVAHKLHEGEGTTELDLLMQEGASVLLYKDEQEGGEAPSKKASKKEKYEQALLKKL